MPDRNVYLVPVITPAMIEAKGLTFIDDQTLGQLLGDGWELSTTMPGRKLTVGGEQVVADMLILKKAEDNRGVTVQRRHEVALEDEAPRGPNTVTQTDEWGQTRQVTLPHAMVHALEGISRGLANIGEAGHLGPAGQHNVPGLQIISGKHISQAFDMGLLAGQRQSPKSENPFPPGSAPSTKWLQGYAESSKVATQKITKEALDEAYMLGYKLAKQLGPHNTDEVHCPHSHPTLKKSWLKGFVDGGGTVV